MNMEAPIYLCEKDVSNLLSWESLIPALEGVLSDITQKAETRTIQPPRLIMPIQDEKGALLCMPSYNGKRQILGCKVVTSFSQNVNRGLPSIFGTVLLLDSQTGKVKMILEGGEITAWRTAGASVVATKHLHKGPKKILAILGAGVQGRIHALAMRHYFQFSEVRVWNRTYERAVKLCNELGCWAKPYDSNEQCVRGADVVVTCTYSPTPVVKGEWLQPGTHINAVGFGVNHHNELSNDIYEQAMIVVDNMPGAMKELQGLIQAGMSLSCELGEVIRGVSTVAKDKRFTVFHSIGMSLEDVVTAELIYNKYMKDHTKNTS